MKLLFFTYDFPVPITSGGKNRAYHMLKYGGKKIDITLFSFYRDIPDNNAIAALEEIGITNIRLFKRPLANFKSLAENPANFFKELPSMAKILNPVSSITKKLYYNPEIATELIRTVKDENISIVHYESLYTAYYMSKALQDMGVRQIFGTENIEYKLYQDYAKTSAKKILMPLYLFESQKIKSDEKNLLNSADYTMAVSRDDADEVTQITSKPCEIIENGVDVDTFAFKERMKNSKKTLLFVGNFTYFPNITAIRDFYTQVFKKLEGDYEFRIIGKDAQSLLIDDPRVVCIEYVKDIRDEYYGADLFVFPIKIGGGTNFKIVEAMSCGLPIVGYKDRMQSVGIEMEKHAFTVKDAQDFITSIQKILSDETKRKSVAKDARKFVQENYSWQVIGKKLNMYWIGLRR